MSRLTGSPLVRIVVAVIRKRHVLTVDAAPSDGAGWAPVGREEDLLSASEVSGLLPVGMIHILTGVSRLRTLDIVPHGVVRVGRYDLKVSAPEILADQTLRTDCVVSGLSGFVAGLVSDPEFTCQRATFWAALFSG